MFKIKNIFFKIILVSSILLFVLLNNSFAQEDWSKYPERDITVILGGAPGGGSDVLAQAIHPYLSKYLGVNFINVYKPGGSGAVAIVYWLQNTIADGYTIDLTTTPQAYAAVVLHPDEADYSMDEVVPIFNVVTDPGVLVVRAESQFQTLDDFIEYAKENPRQVTIANAGIGSDDYISCKLLERIAGIETLLVPFTSDGPSWQAALGGHVTASANNLGNVYGQIKDGAFRALAIFTEERSPIIPDVPTAKELGYEIVNGSSRGYSVKKGTPQEAIDKLVHTFWKVMEDEDFLNYAEKTALILDPMGPEEFSELLKKGEDDFRAAIAE